MMVLSTQDGSCLADYQLNTVPVFDGLAAADGRVFLTRADRRRFCLGAEGKESAALMRVVPLEQRLPRG